jgi:hypothetical protein
MLRTTTAAILAFIIFLIIHLLDFHFLIPQEKIHNLLWAATFGLIMLALILCYLPKEEWFQEKLHIDDKKMKHLIYPILGALFYGFLFLGYLEFYFTAERSITFRMLMLVDKQPDHTITRDKMFAEYDIPGIIDKRFSDLTYGGYLTQKDDSYHLTNKGDITLSIYRFAIQYLHLGSGERKPSTPDN